MSGGRGQPADYVPLHPADDLARCLRYYEMWDSDSLRYSRLPYYVQWNMSWLKASQAMTPTVTITQGLGEYGVPGRIILPRRSRDRLGVHSSDPS